MVWQLTVFAVPLEDLASLPRTHMAAHKTVSNSRESTAPLLDLHRNQHRCDTHWIVHNTTTNNNNKKHTHKSVSSTAMTHPGSLTVLPIFCGSLGLCTSCLPALHSVLPSDSLTLATETLDTCLLLGDLRDYV